MSVIELLVAVTVAGVVLAGALSVTLSSRKIFEADQRRTNVNQNLRAALDLVGIDLRQVGERLPADFPALEIIDGTGGAPDTLILRRNLMSAVLPVCEQIDAGTSTDLRVVDSGGTPPQGCDPVLDGNADGWPDNIEQWRDARDAAGGAIRAYVYNPVTRQGEFFTYDGEGTTDDYFNRADADPWQNTYTVAQLCRVYIVEEKVYSMSQDLLQFVTSSDMSTPINLVDHLTDFQIQAVLQGGVVRSAFTSSDDWDELIAIDVTVSGEAQLQQMTISRTLSARFFPRNILSL